MYQTKLHRRGRSERAVTKFRKIGSKFFKLLRTRPVAYTFSHFTHMARSRSVSGVFQKYRARPSSNLNNDIDNDDDDDDDDDDYDNDSSLLTWLRYFLRRMILRCLFNSVLFVL